MTERNGRTLGLTRRGLRLAYLPSGTRSSKTDTGFPYFLYEDTLARFKFSFQGEKGKFILLNEDPVAVAKEEGVEVEALPDLIPGD